LRAIGTIDLVGKHGGAVHDVGEGGDDAAERIGQEDVGVLAGVGGQFADEVLTYKYNNEAPNKNYTNLFSTKLCYSGM